MNGRTGLEFLGHCAIVAAVAVSVSACGGGGGDGGGAPGSVDITLANQNTLAHATAVAIQGGFVSDSAGGIAGSGNAGVVGSDRKSAQSGATHGLAPSVQWLAVVRSGLLWPLSSVKGQDNGRARIAAVHDLTPESCIYGGSITGTIDDRDASLTVSVGDVLTLVYNACKSSSAAETVNGTMVSTYTQIVPPPTLTIGANVSLGNFGLSNANTGRSATYNGNFALTYAEPSATVGTVRMVVGSALVAQVAGPVYADTVTLHASYLIDSSYDSSAVPPMGTVAGRTTTTVGGQFSSSVAAGSVQISTMTPIVQYDVDAYPREGRVDVLGKNGSLALTALSTTSVQIDFDQGDGGTYEASKVVSWDWLL